MLILRGRKLHYIDLRDWKASLGWGWLLVWGRGCDMVQGSAGKIADLNG
ncbi:Hypothetical protein LOCK908_1308 [Lacticaseibacillus rhamnosus LOCK908]|jgi:hypothetical protein|nr:hypothetical protein LRHK_1247 [Lacticaseibacillus rhamnosus ATCC 8530]AGP73947.1 Hypothetical protein LOCK908_1308 [Lacticaseibacillus rhamnosus LOCK908]